MVCGETCLQEAFALNRRPTREQQENLARKLQLELATVANFFMNARRRNALPLATSENAKPALPVPAAASAENPSTTDASDLHRPPPAPAPLSDAHSVEAVAVAAAAAAELPNGFGQHSTQAIDAEDAKLPATRLPLPLSASPDRNLVSLQLPPDYSSGAAPCSLGVCAELLPPGESVKDMKSDRLLFGFAPHQFVHLVEERDGRPAAPSPTATSGPLASWV